MKFNKKDNSRKKNYQRQKYYLGRTISGASVNQTKVERTKIKQMRIRKKQLTFWFSSIMVLILIVLILIFQLINNITVVISDGEQNLDLNLKKTNKYQKDIREYLNKHPIERIGFLLDKKSLTNYLFNQNKEIKELELSKVGSFMQPDVFTVTVRKPIAMLKIANYQLYVDKEGISYLNNPLPVQPSLKIIDRAGVEIDLQSKMISRSLIEFVGLTINLFKEAGYEVNQVIIPPNTVHQIEVKVDYYDFPIKMTLDNDSIQQVATIKEVLKDKNISKKIKYLDGRVPGKIFYK